jgi:putative transposase
VRHGILHNKSGDLQRYSCRECGKRFTMNLGFERMQANPRAITSAMQLYFSGESFRNVQKFLRMQGMKVSHVTVYNWIGKYVSLMEEYLKDFTPKVGDTWRTDEMYVKFSGKMNYLFAMMDDETRFRISQMVAEHKGTDDVRPMFKGFQIFHNYVRPHEGLNGKTPAEAAGITIEGSNKWLTLIQNAAHVQSQHPRACPED